VGRINPIGPEIAIRRQGEPSKLFAGYLHLALARVGDEDRVKIVRIELTMKPVCEEVRQIHRKTEHEGLRQNVVEQVMGIFTLQVCRQAANLTGAEDFPNKRGQNPPGTNLQPEVRL